MKKFRLDDIDKGINFTAPPDDYFDRLPKIIQSKTSAREGLAEKRWTGWFSVWKLVPAVAAVLLVLWVTGVFRSKPQPSMDELLAGVTATDIISYLEASELTPEELLQEVDVEALSNELYLDHELLDALEIEDQVLLDWYGEETNDGDWL